jgi:hypothetical protein
MSQDVTSAYIADLQQQIERLKRHNAKYNPEYDPERDAPLDAAWEEGNRAAWRDIVSYALKELTGEDDEVSRAVVAMSRQLADMDLELRELWTTVAEDEPFPEDVYRPDVLKQIRRMVE